MSGKHAAYAFPMAGSTEGPMERLAALFDAHHDRLYRLARRLAPSADEALDLVQETFLRAAKFPGSIPASATGAEAWLVRVLINIQRDQWRKVTVRDRHEKSVARRGEAANRGADAEAPLIAKRAVWQALDILPPRRRAILVMFELEGLGVPAIASLLGISEITVRWHLSMGRRRLAARLKAYTGETDEKP